MTTCFKMSGLSMTKKAVVNGGIQSQGRSLAIGLLMVSVKDIVGMILWMFQKKCVLFLVFAEFSHLSTEVMEFIHEFIYESSDSTECPLVFEFITPYYTLGKMQSQQKPAFPHLCSTNNKHQQNQHTPNQEKNV